MAVLAYTRHPVVADPWEGMERHGRYPLGQSQDEQLSVYKVSRLPHELHLRASQ